jgi:hypothetical protein
MSSTCELFTGGQIMGILIPKHDKYIKVAIYTQNKKQEPTFFLSFFRKCTKISRLWQKKKEIVQQSKRTIYILEGPLHKLFVS